MFSNVSALNETQNYPPVCNSKLVAKISSSFMELQRGSSPDHWHDRKRDDNKTRSDDTITLSLTAANTGNLDSGWREPNLAVLRHPTYHCSHSLCAYQLITQNTRDSSGWIRISNPYSNIRNQFRTNIRIYSNIWRWMGKHTDFANLEYLYL